MPTDKILLISWSLPSTPTGSGCVTRNLAQNFTRDEMVIVGEKGVNDIPVLWDSNWPEVVSVQSVWPFVRRGQRWWRLLQFPSMAIGCVRAARKYRCTVILVCYPNELFLLAGCLTAFVCGARLFPYYHNLYVENLSGTHRRFGDLFQKLVFGRSECVFLMSAGMEAVFKSRYPTVKTTVLPHAFNDGVREEQRSERSRDGTIRLAMLGNINESCMDSVQRVAGVVKRNESLRLTILSGTDDRVFEALGLVGDRIRHISPGFLEIQARLREADILFLPLGFKGSLSREEYQSIFPTRTIEYLVSGRPIIAHSPPRSYLTEYLNSHQCALVVDSASESRLEKAILDLYGDPRRGEKYAERASAAAAEFRAAKVINVLKDVVCRGRTAAEQAT